MPPLTPAQKQITANIDAELTKLKTARSRQKDAIRSLQKSLEQFKQAENLRSEAEKKLEQQRKDLIRNWAG